jgi:YHS domain-containing protein
MAKAIDPICHMEVDTDNPTGGQSEYKGTTYYFCAPGCKRAFDQDPEKYLAGEHAGGHQHQAAPQRVSFISRLFGKKP